MIARFLLLALTASIFVAGGAPMSALQTGSACAGSGGFFTAPVPKPPKGKGDKCVADTDFMRRNGHRRQGTAIEVGCRQAPIVGLITLLGGFLTLGSGAAVHFLTLPTGHLRV